MEIKKEFMLRKIAGENILVPMGETAITFNGLISLNELGGFIWSNIDSSKDKKELLGKILEKYEVDEETAKSDMEEFLEILREADII